MPSMSYCIFQNTIRDLYQAEEKLQDLRYYSEEELKETMSDDEYRAYLTFLNQIDDLYHNFINNN